MNPNKIRIGDLLAPSDVFRHLGGNAVRDPQFTDLLSDVLDMLDALDPIRRSEFADALFIAAVGVLATNFLNKPDRERHKGLRHAVENLCNMCDGALTLKASGNWPPKPLVE